MLSINREQKLNLLIIVVILALPSAALWLQEPFYITWMTKVVILALAGVGLNLALGLGGLVSFGHAAFFGIGGYVAGILASHAFNDEWLFNFFGLQVSGSSSMLLIWLLAIIVAAIIAAVIGYFSLRTQGVYFIMITLAFAQMIYYFAIAWPAYGGTAEFKYGRSNDLFCHLL